MDYLIHDTEHFTIKQSDMYRIPGYLIVESKADVTTVAGFDAESSSDLLQCVARAEALLQQVLQPERVYIMKFGEMNPRVHFHVFPRTRHIGDAYRVAAGDEAPYSGARLVDWIWTHDESLGFTDQDIQSFIDAARNHVNDPTQNGTVSTDE